MKTKLMSIALLMAILLGAVALPSPVAAKKGLSTPITGTVENGGTFYTGPWKLDHTLSEEIERT
jgi:hypothetical protein